MTPVIGIYPPTPDWTDIGRGSDDHNGITTCIYSGSSPSGRGIIFTYDPLYLNWEGRILYEKMLHYIDNTPVALTPVPSGRVALLIANYTYTSPDNLTAREAAVRKFLTGKGYTVYIVPNYNRTFTNLTTAKFAVQVENFGFSQHDYYDRQ